MQLMTLPPTIPRLKKPDFAPEMPTDPKRSKIMRAVPRFNSQPEILVRKTLHSLGLRFRLHRKDLPGTPDIVLPKFKTAIFVHGCFWHRHHNCSKSTIPKTRKSFWEEKFRANVMRDARNEELLRAMGWRVQTIWECETSDAKALREKLSAIFGIKSTSYR